jgi:hypothetical protein
VSHYYFHVRLLDQQVLLDTDGLDFESRDEAVAEGRAAAREMMAECLTHNVPSMAQSILVCDANGDTVKAISLDISPLLDRINA